ncbi:MAG TPA: S8 family serine peptidase [Candidatus Nanopelagicales bacterium]|nr:S8 family serine peptidase [Candidatus Nanopelagicales bacterium]
MPSRRRRLVAILVSLLFALSVAAPALAVDPPARPTGPLPQWIEKLKLPAPETGTVALGEKLDLSLRAARGPKNVVVSLSELAAADVADQGPAAEKAQVKKARAQQDTVIASATSLDANTRILGRTGTATNVVMLSIDAASLAALAADPAVVSIKPVIDYQTSLEETVPYVGATAVQGLGFTGKGVRVAVLDSGIDYTHVAFGGPGTLAAYEAAYGLDPADVRNTTPDGLFPTAKVVGGYDFVGEAWVGGASTPPLAPDPDPIDYEGHGTHVADIIGGAKGVSPGVSLYAVKVCASQSTACSGVALIEGMDFVVDPNGDGSTADHVDVVNMSLGSLYGIAFDDDLSYAVDQASKVGVLSVTAAGNGGNKPYILDSPSAAKSALSVAQTAVPSSVQAFLRIVAPASIAGLYSAVFQPWSAPLTAVIEGPVQYGDGAGGNADGCAAFAAGSLAGKIVLVDRGACSFSIKISNIAAGGGLAGLIGLIDSSDPFEGGFGGGDPSVPGYMISRADANTIRSELAAGVTARLDPADGIALAGSMVGSSSRGPAMSTNLLKPEIGAPGASVSAVAGTGTETIAFGGTSGATPMVSGAAALLRGAFPGRPIGEIKSVLMNTAETGVYTNAATAPGVFAPISRIGGGELRVDRALASPAAAWDTETMSGGLGFGFVDASSRFTTLVRDVTVRNYTRSILVYRVEPTFRSPDDAANGAVSVSAPRLISVPPRGTTRFTVTLTINGSLLRPWTLDSGANGNNPAPLDLLEYDGYLLLDNTRTTADNADPLHIAWHVLPRLADDVDLNGERARMDPVRGEGAFTRLRDGDTWVHNRGVGPAYIDAYSLVGTSPNLPPSVPGGNAPVVDLRAVGVQTFPVPAGFCSADASFVYTIAINTWERTTLALAHNEFSVFLDTNQDGTADYVVQNADISGPFGLTAGQSVTWAFNLGDPDEPGSAYFYTDHGTNAANTVLTICGEQIGMNATNFFEPMTMDVVAFDNYFTGNATDAIDGIVVAPYGERYLGVFGADGFGSGDIAPFSSAKLTVVDFGAANTNPSETGVLLVLDAARGEIRGGAPRNNEALVVRVKP